MRELIVKMLKSSIKKTNHDGIVSHWVGDLSVDDIRYVIEYIEVLEKQLKELEDMIPELKLEHRFMRARNERLEKELQLNNKIKEWAKDRGLDVADPTKQMLKLMEEVGELSSAIARSDEWKTADAIGDIYVVLTILSLQLGLDIMNCVEAAYEEIKDRKGQMVNGVYVKESDLKACSHGPEPDACPDCRKNDLDD